MLDPSALYWIGTALLGTLGVTLGRAAERAPDPMNADFEKPLNRMLTNLFSGVALVIFGALSLYRFGLLWPVAAGVVLYVTHRLALSCRLSAFYKYMLPISALALLCAVLLLGSELLGGTDL